MVRQEINHTAIVLITYYICVLYYRNTMENSAQMPVITGKLDILTGKEERFCYEYCIDRNATKCAIRVGYSQRTARSIGSTLLTKVNIQNKLREIRTNLAKAAGISALRIIKEHEKIAFLNTGKLRDGWFTPSNYDSLTDDQKSCIQEISTTPGKHGDSLKVKVYDKQKSLESLADLLGFRAPTKNEITGKGGKDLITSINIEIVNRADQVNPESKNN